MAATSAATAAMICGSATKYDIGQPFSTIGARPGENEEVRDPATSKATPARVERDVHACLAILTTLFLTGMGFIANESGVLGWGCRNNADRHGGGCNISKPVESDEFK